MEDRTTLLRINELWKDLKTKGQNHSYLTYLEQFFFFFIRLLTILKEWFFIRLVTNLRKWTFIANIWRKLISKRRQLISNNSGQRPTQSSRGIIKDVEFAPSSKGQLISERNFGSNLPKTDQIFKGFLP